MGDRRNTALFGAALAVAGAAVAADHLAHRSPADLPLPAAAEANPCAANPCAANPCAANPCAAAPATENPCAANPCAANPCAAG